MDPIIDLAPNNNVGAHYCYSDDVRDVRAQALSVGAKQIRSITVRQRQVGYLVVQNKLISPLMPMFEQVQASAGGRISANSYSSAEGKIPVVAYF